MWYGENILNKCPYIRVQLSYILAKLVGGVGVVPQKLSAIIFIVAPRIL